MSITLTISNCLKLTTIVSGCGGARTKNTVEYKLSSGDKRSTCSSYRVYCMIFCFVNNGVLYKPQARKSKNKCFMRSIS